MLVLKLRDGRQKREQREVDSQSAIGHAMLTILLGVPVSIRSRTLGSAVALGTVGSEASVRDKAIRTAQKADQRH